MQARWVLLLGGLLLGCGALFWSMGPSATDAAPGLPAPATRSNLERTRAEDPSPPASEPDQHLAPRERARETAAAEEGAAEEGAPETPPEDGALLLHGRVHVVDVGGRDLAPLDGRFEITVWRGRRGHSQTVEFSAGEWSTHIQDPGSASHLTLRNLTADPLLLRIEAPQDRIELPHEGLLEIRGRAAPTTILRVLDARDGRDLADVELIEAAWQEDPHPGPVRERLAEGLRSPIDFELSLPADRRRAASRLYVGAHGYVWSKVDLDLEAGGERIVALEPGGDLKVALEGLLPRSGAELRLRLGGDRAPLLSVAARAELLLERLPPGPLRVSVEIGRPWDDPLVLGETQVEIVAGGRAHAALALAAPPEPVRADAQARGVLLLSKAWQAEPPRVTATRIDKPGDLRTQAQAVPSSPVPHPREDVEAFAWQLSGLRAGRHVLEVDEPPAYFTVEIPPAGLEGLELELPPPASLRVRVVEAGTGRDVVLEHLRWFLRHEHRGGFSPRHAARDPETGLYVIRAPATRIELMIWDWDFTSVTESVDLSSGLVEHTLRLEPTQRVEIVLRDGETPIPFPKDSSLELEPADGSDARAGLRAPGRLQHIYQLPHPGTWTFEAPTIPGYLKPPLQRVEVRAREVTRHVVELERAHR